MTINEDSLSTSTNEDQKEVTKCNIEQILVEIYNHYIKSNCENIHIGDLSRYKNEVRALAQTFDDQCNIFIMKTLLLKIKELIQRYKDKIYETIELSNIKDIMYPRTKSLDHFTSKRLITRYSMKAYNNKQCLRLHSFTKNTYKNESCDKSAVQTVFTKLVNVKIVLIKASKDIEEIFKYAKSEFSNFSIEQCQREEYLNVIVKDDFIQFLIQHNRSNELMPLIEEIEEDKALNIQQMTIFTETLNNCKPKQS